MVRYPGERDVDWSIYKSVEVHLEGRRLQKGWNGYDAMTGDGVYMGAEDNVCVSKQCQSWVC